MKKTEVKIKDKVDEHVYKLLCSCGRYRMIDGYRVKDSPVKMFSKLHKQHFLTLYLLRERF